MTRKTFDFADCLCADRARLRALQKRQGKDFDVQLGRSRSAFAARQATLARPVFGANFNNGDFARRETVIQQATNQCGGHVAATKKWRHGFE